MDEEYRIEELNKQINDLEQDCTQLITNSNFLAKLSRILSTFIFFIEVSLSIVSAYFGFTEHGKIAGILSICTTCVEIFRSNLSLSIRGKTFKDIYLATLDISRKSRGLKKARISIDDVEKKLDKLRDKLTSLQLSMYETALLDYGTSTAYTEHIEHANTVVPTLPLPPTAPPPPPPPTSSTIEMAVDMETEI